MALRLAVVGRVDAEIVRRVAGMHAPGARERMRVARLRADDLELRLEGDAPRDPVARERIAEVVRAQRRERRVEVRRHGDALGAERDDVVAVELDEAAERQRERDGERCGGAKRRRERERDEQREERQDERQVARLRLQPRVRRDEVEEREDDDDSSSGASRGGRRTSSQTKPATSSA